eukprot:gb/GECG01004777.1/.p1 GENE.gb/GECG01004777.1/~~gb/GECG01004777.1/.p1  ORF type:complete len:103 (+),score=10.23 gb/GECG01004777.1/:1-309(+)
MSLPKGVDKLTNAAAATMETNYMQPLKERASDTYSSKTQFPYPVFNRIAATEVKFFSTCLSEQIFCATHALNSLHALLVPSMLFSVNPAWKRNASPRMFGTP